MQERSHLRVCGWMWEISTQKRHPFEAHLELAPEGLAGFKLLFGDASAADGFANPKFITLGAAREWLFRLEESGVPS